MQKSRGGRRWGIHGVEWGLSGRFLFLVFSVEGHACGKEYQKHANAGDADEFATALFFVVFKKMEADLRIDTILGKVVEARGGLDVVFKESFFEEAGEGVDFFEFEIEGVIGSLFDAG